MTFQRIAYSKFSLIVLLSKLFAISTVEATTLKDYEYRYEKAGLKAGLDESKTRRPNRKLFLDEKDVAVDVSFEGIKYLLGSSNSLDSKDLNDQIKYLSLWKGRGAIFVVRYQSGTNEDNVIEGIVSQTPTVASPRFEFLDRPEKVDVDDILFAQIIVRKDVENLAQFQRKYSEYSMIQIDGDKFPVLSNGIELYQERVAIYITNAFGEKRVIEGIVKRYPIDKEYNYWNIETIDGMISIPDLGVINVQEVRLLSQKQYY